MAKTKKELAELAVKLFDNIDQADQFDIKDLFYHCDNAFLLYLINCLIHSFSLVEILPSIAQISIQMIMISAFISSEKSPIKSTISSVIFFSSYPSFFKLLNTLAHES